MTAPVEWRIEVSLGSEVQTSGRRLSRAGKIGTLPRTSDEPQIHLPSVTSYGR
jgi:hypothetical protein